MEYDVIRKVYESINRGESVALATITSSSGSTPGKSGAIMAVWKDQSIAGSVGGGKIEFEVIQKSVQCILEDKDDTFDYNLNDSGDLGMKCGGNAKGFIKLFRPTPKLIIVGAGHIGYQLHKLAKVAGFYTVVVDDRAEYATEERFKNSEEFLIGDIFENLSNYNISENTYVVITSRGHETDKAALRAVINKKLRYIGMIGSKRKKTLLMEELIALGVEKDDLEKVYCPIGIDISLGIPEEIAFGIMAEILLVKNGGSLKHRKYM